MLDPAQSTTSKNIHLQYHRSQGGPGSCQRREPGKGPPFVGPLHQHLSTSQGKPLLPPCPIPDPSTDPTFEVKAFWGYATFEVPEDGLVYLQPIFWAGQHPIHHHHIQGIHITSKSSQTVQQPHPLQDILCCNEVLQRGPMSSSGGGGLAGPSTLIGSSSSVGVASMGGGRPVVAARGGGGGGVLLPVGPLGRGVEGFTDNERASSDMMSRE
jgi:hypothetical protein